MSARTQYCDLNERITRPLWFRLRVSPMPTVLSSFRNQVEGVPYYTILQGTPHGWPLMQRFQFNPFSYSFSPFNLSIFVNPFSVLLLDKKWLFQQSQMAVCFQAVTFFLLPHAEFSADSVLSCSCEATHIELRSFALIKVLWCREANPQVKKVKIRSK